MTDPRKPIFDAIRAAKGRILEHEVPYIDDLLDRLGIARAGAAAPDRGGVPDDYFPMLARIESGNRPHVKAASSSASGLYQFIRSTWRGEGGSWGPDMSKAFGGLFPTEAEQTARARSFTEKNAAALRQAGIPINRATLYAAHFLGVATAVRILRASDGAPADQLAGDAATRANPSILRGKTVGQFKAWLARKTGDQA